ncbi:MAG: LysR family transcriptional regulator [Alcanivorax sp.]|jgi:DNA-binding transcriptional LysR family regulator|uniref:LysR family transcriptional regulator n=1 Tax=Thalassolituus oleivorans TaxID=187493 RepID=UPI0023F2E3B0|nr:LysR family transcriptional regulator [Thalassolituus oleivorans]|tara:strand:- start:171 stop:1106 length:936 start_codon:yes stop_codon:yes gene_type:complete
MKTTLEQWRMFRAVVEHGGYAQAADAIYKSQSTISYGVHKLQEQLGVQLLEVEGRKAFLTPEGKTLLLRAERLLDQAEGIDRVAASLSGGTESLLRVARDMIYPCEQLFCALENFSKAYPHTRIELEEFVLSGGDDLLEADKVDLLITAHVPTDRQGQHVCRCELVPVTSANHPLQTLGRRIGYDDLIEYRQVVLRDSGKKRNVDSGWLGANQRWTVTHVSTSVNIVKRGLAFAWLPSHWVEQDIAAGNLAVIPFEEEATRYADLYLIKAHPDSVGPAAQALYELLSSKEEFSYPNDANKAKPLVMDGSAE